jgi:DNA primase
MNLYNLNNSKDNIKLSKAAIVFEGEKSSLLYQSYFGLENDISVACCGSNISAYQVQLLLDAGAKEMIIAFDRQW